MELKDIIRIIRKRWWIIVTAMLIGLAGAALASAQTPTVYQAQTRLFVSTPGATDSRALKQGNDFTAQRVKSYAEVIRTRTVLDPVIKTLNLDTTAAVLGNQVTATVPLGTVLIQITVTNSDPRLAAKIADAVGKQVINTVADLETVAGGKPSIVKLTVLTAPTVPTTPISPEPTRKLNLGVMLGLLFGLGLAILRDLLDTTIKNAEDCANVTDTTVIGGVAFDSDAPKRPLIVHADPHSPFANPYRTLRTNLQFVNAANPPRSIVITSSVPGEGKTTTAANLAIAMAAEGARVCLIEGNLQHPRLLEYMGMDGSLGLTNVLIGQAALGDVLQQFNDTSVYAIGAGSTPPNPGELLGSAAMIEILRELESRFDLVMIDSPALLRAADAGVLSSIAGGTVVVVGAKQVDRADLAGSLQSLAGDTVRVLGLVLNKIPTKARKPPRTTATAMPLPHHAIVKDRERAGS